MLSRLRQSSTIHWLILFFLIVIFFAYLFFLTRDFLHYREQGYLHFQNSPRSIVRRYIPDHQALPERKPINVNEIQDWMTFHYLVVVFHLPNDYFKEALHITDLKYFSKSLLKYAKEQKILSSTLLTSVRNSIAEYQARSGPMQK